MKTDIWVGTMAAIAGISLFSATGVLTAASAQEDQRIRIRMGDQTVTATLNGSEAVRDLVAILPLSIRMRDHLGREKTGPLPGPLSERTNGSRSQTQEPAKRAGRFPRREREVRRRSRSPEAA
jgi:hypothetical protein